MRAQKILQGDRIGPRVSPVSYQAQRSADQLADKELRQIQNKVGENHA